MLTKISRAACLERFPLFPQRHLDPVSEEESYSYPQVFQSYVLTLPSRTFRGQASLLGKEFALLAKWLGAEQITFLAESETPWLYREHDYPPAKKGQQYLVENGVGKRFNGALVAPLAELPVFIEHLAWMVRCNAILPQVYFMDERSGIVGSLCQYGNLHLDSLNAATDALLNAAIDAGSFERGDYSSCGSTGALAGRSLEV